MFIMKITATHLRVMTLLLLTFFIGNTVLHMLVIHNKLDMFDLVLNMSPPDLLRIKNNKGMSNL